VKGITVLISCFLAASACAGSIIIESSYPSDVSGNPVSVALGDTFYMTVKLHTAYNLNGPYRVRFDLPYMSRTSKPFSYVGDAYVVWGPYPALTDGTMAVKTTVVSSTDDTGQPLTIELTPTLPGQGIEFFNPQGLSGSYGAMAKLASGTIGGLQWLAPLPQDGGFQNVASIIQPGATVFSAPYTQPVATASKVSSIGVQFETASSSARVNPSILRSVGFSAYVSLPVDIEPWLRPETLIESTNSEITQFVRRALPMDYRLKMGPYNAAENLFQVVVAHMRYVASTAKPDALAALQTGRGECGAFSALFVACCRNAGIPARTVSGMLLGNNQWHVWSEFYLPGYGWIPVDPTFCQALMPDGSMPLYFGTIPELNQRAALTYGFDHFVSGYDIPVLQSPAVISTGGTKVSSVQAWCNLTPN